MSSSANVCVFLLWMIVHDNQCLRIIPERTDIVFYNKTYVEDTPTFNVRRNARKGDYVVNLKFETKVKFGNEVLVDIVFYQFLNNEFKRSFPEMHYKLCDLINEDPYIGDSIREAGLKSCPIVPGKYALMNIGFNRIIPSVWPFEKGMVEFTISLTDPKAIIGKGQLVTTFKEERPKKKHNK
ncbi:unnamed protein product [Spodoptera exigua]|uniref:Uncharacterized protein n=1 Tax=Spodoptera exigua TaxID=7107 RepID=A0A835L2S7_SPOEX|nr:hypothetical protein HW555_010234 [Spodoptera exigua]KAH9641934.1 hypothetical protein HF086_011684 [Spodoptera exigua]CAH0669159.1 unnamed protein product [Spodoptera exigua]